MRSAPLFARLLAGLPSGDADASVSPHRHGHRRRPAGDRLGRARALSRSCASSPRSARGARRDDRPALSPARTARGAARVHRRPLPPGRRWRPSRAACYNTFGLASWCVPQRRRARRRGFHALLEGGDEEPLRDYLRHPPQLRAPAERAWGSGLRVAPLRSCRVNGASVSVREAALASECRRASAIHSGHVGHSSTTPNSPGAGAFPSWAARLGTGAPDGPPDTGLRWRRPPSPALDQLTPGRTSLAARAVALLDLALEVHGLSSQNGGP